MALINSLIEITELRGSKLDSKRCLKLKWSLMPIFTILSLGIKKAPGNNPGA